MVKRDRPTLNRRKFLGASTSVAGSVLSISPLSAAPDTARLSPPGGWERQSLDLSPARWIWYPCGRFLHNSFVLFRKEFDLGEAPTEATGWVLADSRYLLYVNGERVQWGPAPCDPRWLEADPLDLSGLLRPGANLIAVQCLYYGAGDGTSPMGKPGLIFRLEVKTDRGEARLIYSDETWLARLGTAWKLGQYKRWYLRSLQEEFDGRNHPEGWHLPDHSPDRDWLHSMVLDCPANRPPICAANPEYALDIQGDSTKSRIFVREIPFMGESFEPAKLRRVMALQWHRPIEEFFAVRTPGSLTAAPGSIQEGEDGWRGEIPREGSLALTFELDEHMVGWPGFELEAPAGTVVELLVHDAHDPQGPTLLNLDLNAWSRFTCREGLNRFEEFDYESGRWLQLNLHGPGGEFLLRRVGMRRRRFPWPQEPDAACSDPGVARAIRASVNTLVNAAQDSVVDTMGRERQQYSGDVGHQMHALLWACGETRLAARYLRTFNQGITLDGYFLDCWPAYDRLARLSQRQLDLTPWGPLVDHGVGHVFDTWHFFRYSGDVAVVREVLPRLARFAVYLEQQVGKDGLIPTEDLGVPWVWIDHSAYRRQRDKQCAFNLYVAAMFRHVLPDLAAAVGEQDWAEHWVRVGGGLADAVLRHFWDSRRRILVVNRPWEDEDPGIRFCDRSLALALLYDICPSDSRENLVRTLADPPPELGLSYVPNACWRYWALADSGRVDVVVRELATTWADMPSVRWNNSISEFWDPKPDTRDQWSHCGVVPLYLMYTSLAGVRALEPGCRRLELRPQPGPLEALQMTLATAVGPVRFESAGSPGDRTLTIVPPPGAELEVVLDEREEPGLPELLESKPGLRRFRLPQTGIRALGLRWT